MKHETTFILYEQSQAATSFFLAGATRAGKGLSCFSNTVIVPFHDGISITFRQTLVHTDK